MDKIGLIQQAAQVHTLAQLEPGFDVFADLEHADDVVDGVLIDGDAAVAGRADQGQHLLRRRVHRQGVQVHPGGEDALHRHVAEAQGPHDQFPLVGVQLSLVGHGLDDVIQLILRHRDLSIAAGQLRRGLANGGQQGGEGGENAHKKAQRSGRSQREALAVLFGDALRQHFAQQKHGHGGDGGAQRHGAQAPAPRDQDGDVGRRRQVDDVGADEDGGNGFVEMLGDPDGVFGAPVAPVQGCAQPGTAHRGKGGLADGKIARGQQQKQDEYGR